ncbi:MAG: acyltransferase family protein [Acidimicrobiales bacterium]
MAGPGTTDALSPPAADGATPLREPEPPQPGQPYSRRLPFLDGIRAFAVLAVVLYHAGISWVGGGLLGVDVFFVLSGFLITSLLCTEFAASATVRLRAFYVRRARRLLPALFVLLLGVSAYAYFFSSTVDVSSVRGDAFSTLFYYANWHFVLSDQGYFVQSAAPSPLLQTWSLAVEEQYYLVWPLVALFVLHRWDRSRLAVVAGVGALASAGLMAAMFHAGISTDRLYYGTDTRAQALLVGSFLGVVSSGRAWRTFDPRWARSRRGRTTGAVLAVAGCAGLAWAWHALQGQDPFLYDGGFLLVAVFAAVVIATVMSWPRSALALLLSARPLVLLGRISYGVYLYHWPLFLVIDQAHTGLQGLPLLVVRLAVTFAAAYVSWRYVEEPVRRRRWLTSWRAGTATATVAAGTAAVVFAATIAPAAAALPPAAEAGRSALPAAEAAQLRADHAFTTNPVRFLMVGDSVAWSAARGLRVGSHRHYGIRIVNGGVLGCDLDRTPSRFGGVVYAGEPGVNCGSWPSVWSGAVAHDRPQVVGLLIGRFELGTHLHDGRWVHVGDPGWDAHLERQLNQAVELLSAKGARVAVFTFPYIDPPLEQPDGAPWPENVPSRVVAWNRLLRQVAASHPRTVTLVPLNHLLDPQGHYTNTVDGVGVRTSDDGIHITMAGAEWLQPRVLPEIARLGLEDRHPASGA